jgi:hypothetical protein
LTLQGVARGRWSGSTAMSLKPPHRDTTAGRGLAPRPAPPFGPSEVGAEACGSPLRPCHAVTTTARAATSVTSAPCGACARGRGGRRASSCPPAELPC